MSLAPPDPLFTFHGEMKSVLSVHYQEREGGNAWIYCGTESGHVHVWDANFFRQLKKIKVGSLPCIAILSHVTFITQEKGGPITFWMEVDTEWEKVTSIMVSCKMFCKISVVGSSLIVPYSDSQVKIIDLMKIDQSVSTETEYDGELGMAMCLKYTSKHDRILMCFETGTIACIRPNGKFETRTKFNTECPMCIDYCDSKDFGIVGYNSRTLFKFKCTDTREIRHLQSVELTNPGVSAVAIRKDGSIFAIGTWNGAIKYFSVKTMKLLAVLPHHTSSIECLLFTLDVSEKKSRSNDENQLLAGSLDGRLSLWNLYPT